MAKHLILGGSGFIGRHVALQLARRGDEVTIADRFPPPEMPTPEGRQVSFKEINLADARWDALVADHDVIHHYAWSTIPQTANEDPVADLDVNVVSTLRLYEAVRRRGAGRIVFSSSGGTVYGKLSLIPVPEHHPLQPITAYGVSKLAAENYLRFFRAIHGVDGRVARLSNPFGAGQDPRRNQGAASVFLHQALRGEPITIWGDGEVVRDYIHISDTVHGLVALADADLRPSPDLPIFNIASGQGLSLNGIVAALQSRLNHPVEVDYLTGRPFDIPISVLDITRAYEAIGWKPRLSFEEGIELTLSDCRSGAQAYSTIL